MAKENMRWRCNACPDRVEVLKDETLGQAVALHHADCTELVIGGVLGDFKYGTEEQREEFAKQGIVGIYVPLREVSS